MRFPVFTSTYRLRTSPRGTPPPARRSSTRRSQKSADTAAFRPILFSHPQLTSNRSHESFVNAKKQHKVCPSVPSGARRRQQPFALVSAAQVTRPARTYVCYRSAIRQMEGRDWRTDEFDQPTWLGHLPRAHVFDRSPDGRPRLAEEARSAGSRARYEYSKESIEEPRSAKVSPSAARRALPVGFACCPDLLSGLSGSQRGYLDF